MSTIQLLGVLPSPGGGGSPRIERSEDTRRGGVTVSDPDTFREERLSPHPVSHLTMRADPPPPGEGEIHRLPVLPCRGALVGEGPRPFLSVARHHGFGHPPGGFTIAVGQGHF